MKSRKLVFAILILAMAGAALYVWSCRHTNNNGGSRPKVITIGTFSKALGNAPYYIARNFRWFEEDPSLKDVTINYKEYNDRPSISDAFSNGDLQVLFSGDAPAILNRAQGNDVRLTDISGNAAQEILVRSELPIHTIGDLRGKRLAVQQGTTSQYALLRILKANGLGETEVQLQYMTAPEAKAAFESGSLDAWAVWAPFVEQEEVSGKGRVLPKSEVLIHSVMSISSGFLAQYEPGARAAVAAIERAKQWMLVNPDQAQRIAAEQLGLDPKVVSTAWPKFDWSAHLNDAVIADLQDKADFLAANDKTRNSKTIDVKKDFVDLRLTDNGAK
jgi:sulfonate transport system substrate-binding protein